MKQLIPVLALLIGCFACKQQPKLITGKQRLNDMTHMLEVQKELTAKSSINVWDIFNQALTENERQAMEFLYAYMPISDLGDYQADFFLANARKSLQARDDLKWVENLPEDIFLQFVLPVRINNENLDSFRIEMYDEIRDRVKNIDNIEQAALEVNHWCHEKVVYRGTDIRTSAPLSTVRKAFGRCGEESTFTVASLRTAGIPARQVYTPRWAHSDDNHAWVEVYINGTWKFLGACEPDARLNMGWFTEPARRAILMHTRTYGKYFGDEPVINNGDRFAELNLTSHYAPVKKLVVEVQNQDETPVIGANVNYELYNYAEYFPLATQQTGADGRTGLELGMGDIIVWASANGQLAFKHVSVAQTDTVKLKLGAPESKPKHFDFDFVPPHLVKDTLQLTAEEKAINERRLAEEDSIRGCYTATFKTDDWSKNLARELGLNEEEVVSAIQKSYGNWDEIEKYLRENAREKNVLTLMSVISDKDFADTKASILTAHLSSAQIDGNCPSSLFVPYVLAPRVANEMLRDWRPFLQVEFAGLKDSVTTNPQYLADWINSHILVDDQLNKHARTPLSPEAVYRLHLADRESRDIFFVAVCRALGIPSRLNAATLEPEFCQNGNWLRALFNLSVPAKPATGKLVLVNGANSIEPQYMVHFTVGKLIDGNYQTLQYPFTRNVSEMGELDLEPGNYCLVTGNRFEDGTVLSSLDFFNISEGKTTEMRVTLRQSANAPQVLAKLDFNSIHVISENDKKLVALEQLAGSGNMVLALLDPNKEPSKHILNDLADYLEHFNAWSGKFVFVAAEDRPQLNQVLETYRLPKGYVSGADSNNDVLNALTDKFGEDIKAKLPLVILTDANGQIYLFSSGYKIGIGEQLLKIIPALPQPGTEACCQP
ncbi:MAG: transglutaminase-like domain-containing protein [Mangrovibacterium sp.]